MQLMNVAGWRSVYPTDNLRGRQGSAYGLEPEGALLLAIAVGIFMRSRIAWMAGFLMIASAWAYSVASLFLTNAKMGPPLAMKIVFAGFGLLVTAYWGSWWYAQRVHFVSTGRTPGLGEDGT